MTRDTLLNVIHETVTALREVSQPYHNDGGTEFVVRWLINVQKQAEQVIALAKATDEERASVAEIETLARQVYGDGKLKWEPGGSFEGWTWGNVYLGETLGAALRMLKVKT